MNRSTRNLLAGVLALAGGLLFNNAPAAATSVFDISQPTHAIVDNKTPVYPAGSPDTSNTFHSGYIYNIFGAANQGVESPTVDMLFTNGINPEIVQFHTALPVSLSDVSLSFRSDDGTTTGNRGATSYTFQQYTNASYSTAVGPLFTDSTLLANSTPNVLPVTVGIGQYFELSIANASGGGTRVEQFTGTGNFVPEPSSFVLCGLGALGLFFAARRRRKA